MKDRIKELKPLLTTIREQSEKVGYLKVKMETTPVHETEILAHWANMMIQAREARQKAFEQFYKILNND